MYNCVKAGELRLINIHSDKKLPNWRRGWDSNPSMHFFFFFLDTLFVYIS